MKRNRYPDATWEAIKTDYCGGESTLRESAKRHGVPFKTVETRCRREGWNRKLKENLQVVKEIAGRSLQERQQELGQRAGDFVIQSAEQLRGLLDDFIERRGLVKSMAEFDTLVDAFSTLVRTGRELYGFDNKQNSNPRTLASISMTPASIQEGGKAIRCQPLDA
ncbi:DUF1804 family protein [Verrucomicrobia bacterium]|nr:DUF1804 family protein [Verrucomicrobiota bacterium]